MVISERFTPPSRENLRSQRRIAERPYDHGGLFRISLNQPARSASEYGGLDVPAPAIGPQTTIWVGGRTRVGLERRLEELQALDDSDIGGFTALDWFFCITGSVVLPAIALWWFAG